MQLSFFVALTTYRPRLRDLAAQVQSLQSQTYGDWVCHIQDDASGPETTAWLQAIATQDPRFTFETNAENLGHYRNFEKCLSRLPPTATHIAYCDQDDVWHPDKLSRHAATYMRTGAIAVHSDYRIVNAEGAVIAPSGFAYEGKSHPSPSLIAELGGNMVTGCSLTFSRDLLQFLLPFPASLSDGRRGFHDWWTGLMAVAYGNLAFIPEPLLDYRQHASNSVGAKRGRFRVSNAIRMLFLPRARWAQGLQDRQMMAQAIISRGPPNLGSGDAKILRRLESRATAIHLALRGGRSAFLGHREARQLLGLAVLCLLAPRRGPHRP